MIAALFVETNGVYFGLPNVDPWDVTRDARLYRGPWPVVAHPPCERWGRYWSGGPMLAGTPRAKKLGDDGGCFRTALRSVRAFGGTLEHPQASHAWAHHGIESPPWKGGWVKADNYGGWTCCVAQGAYGHRAQKMTWLYAVGTALPDLRWGTTPGRVRLDPGFHSNEERRRATKRGVRERLTKQQRAATPVEFRDLLISIASSVVMAGQVRA